MEKKEDYSTLVSIVVVTYNSSKSVLDTLESVKAQTYQNIEIIITDDCSTDNTVEICRHWIEQYNTIQYNTIQYNTTIQ
jgi:alpha-1,3-rhamnosyltransferase